MPFLSKKKYDSLILRIGVAEVKARDADEKASNVLKALEAFRRAFTDSLVKKAANFDKLTDELTDNNKNGGHL